MPISSYMRGLRSLVGTRVLEVPTVSVFTFDEQGRVLLVRQSASGRWSSPGGMVEPYELPAEAALREMWEETGLFVELNRIMGVFGGREFSTVYENGDRLSWVITAFEARVISGELKPDGDETLEVGYFSREEISGLDCTEHLLSVLDVVFSGAHEPYFARSSWRPPSLT